MPNPLELDERDLVAALCRKSLRHFVREGWHVLEPETPLVWNWHLDVLCDHLQAILDPTSFVGQRWTQNLIINVPPGTMKSLLTSVFAPAWQWLRRPSWRAIYCSANPRVALRDSMKCKDLIESQWFQQTFRPTWKLSDDQNAKSNFKNTRGGFRSAFSVGAKVTGDRADALFIDDPLDAADAPSELIRNSCNEWYASAFRNRVASPQKSTRVLIMQRLHEEDLTGYIVEKEKGLWDLLCMPMEAEEPRPPTFLGWQDHRKPGELLMPARFPKVVLDQERLSLGSGYEGQMQQRPTPAGGGLFKREWWRYWRPRDWPEWKKSPERPKDCAAEAAIPLPERFDVIWQSWDCAFKAGERNDFVVGITVGIKGANRFVLEMNRAKRGFTATQDEVRAMRLRYPNAAGVLIEEAANGAAVIETLKEEIPGVIPVTPMGGKESRAAVLEPKVKAGNWILPDGAPWLEAFLHEFGSFPKGKNDDQVDACSQVETYLTNSSYAALLSMCQ